MDYAYEIGLSGLVYTEHESLSGHIRALKYYKQKYKDKDFKLGLGNEIYLCREGLCPDNYEKGEKFPHFILIAKDKEGHHQLRQLSTRAWSHSFNYFMTRVPTYPSDIEEIVGTNPGHIIACSACFLPGQRVKVKEGYKKIEDIKPGDEVYNYMGNYEKVMEPTSRDYKGEGYEVYREGRIDPIRCTANHQFLVTSANYLIGSKAKSSKVFWESIKDIKLYSGSSKRIGIRPLNNNYTNNYIINRDEYCYTVTGPHKNSPRKYTLSSQIYITPEMIRLFGLYLGDGCIDTGIKNKHRINFTFNSYEFPIYYNSFVKKAIKDIGGHWTIQQRPQQHQVNLTCSCLDVYELFYYLFGPEHAESKYIPERLKHISKDYDQELLFGYLLADGYFRSKRKGNYVGGEISTDSISKQLSEDYVDLFNDLGIQVSLYKKEAYIDKNKVHHKPCYCTSIGAKIAGKIDKRKPYSHQELVQLFEQLYVEQSRNRFTDNNHIEYLKIRIKQINSIFIEERVYCLNNTTHSFLCENMIVHNCAGSKLNICRKEGQEEKANEFIIWCKKIFGNDYYLELQPARYEEQIEYNKWLLAKSKEFNVKCIISTDSHYLKKEDFDIHAAFLNSKEGDRETADFYRYTYMMTPDEIRDLTADYIDTNMLSELFRNTNEINEKIEFYDLEQLQQVPHLKDDRENNPTWKDDVAKLYIPDNYVYLNKLLSSQYEDDKYLIFLSFKKLLELRLDKKELRRYIDRLEEEAVELWLVSEKLNQPLSAYLLLVRQCIKIIWEETNSLVGVGRGSCGAFLFCYLIEVIDVNPLKTGRRMDPRRFIYRDKLELPDIDFDSEGGRRDFIIEKMKEIIKQQNGRGLNIATFGTLGTRSAILLAARGLGIANDEAQYLASYTKVERGFAWSIHDMLYGNEEKDRKPVKEFVDAISEYPKLLEMAQKIEGLICQLGIHASGFCFYNGDINDYCCAMKAPNGLEITQWDLHDAEYAGSLKIDLLSIEALDKIHACMNLLIEDKLMEWQGDLRSTYVKYLHPDIINQSNPDMWKALYQLQIIDAFQMDTQVAKNALRMIRPNSTLELSEVNAMMRLMPEKGAITPIEEYVKYKNDPGLLRKEIDELKGDAAHKEILYNFLKEYNGVPSTQESIMYLAMIPELTNFTFNDSNYLRKVCAKKLTKKIPELKEKVYSAGRNNGVSDDILDYMWKQIVRQLG